MSRLSVEDIKRLHQAEAGAPTAPAPEFNRGVTRPEGWKPASEKSIAFLRVLWAERQPDFDMPSLDQIIDGGQRSVSAAIDKIKSLPNIDPRPRPQRSQETFQPRANLYPKQCEHCSLRVEAQEGILTKADDGQWVVSHKPGECPKSQFPFPWGRYAVDTEEGHLAFYVASNDGLFVQASDELHRVKGSAQDAIIEKIAADPEAASRRYGRELRQCGVCGRGLTDEVSRAEGIGPVCASRGFGS